MHALTEVELVMETTIALRDYYLERLADGKKLEDTFYLIVNQGTVVIPIPWASLPANPIGMTKAFMKLLKEHDPDLVAHFTIQNWSTIAANTVNAGDFKPKGTDFKLLVMSVLGKSGSMLHATSLETIPGVVKYGEVFTGVADILAVRFCND